MPSVLLPTPTDHDGRAGDSWELRIVRPGENRGIRKILLVDDDPTFQEIMKDFLVESGFEVVAVQNGVDGVHEVLASDFEVILCDMMMPTLPGDMFFRAVERMRPHLCSRFVFMTGHRGNQRVNDFVSLVSGTILNKPFRIDDLLEVIAFIRARIEIAYPEEPPAQILRAARKAVRRFRTPVPVGPEWDQNLSAKEGVGPRLDYLGDDLDTGPDSPYRDLARVDLVSEIYPEEEWDFATLATILDRRVTPLLAHELNPTVVLSLPLSGAEFDFDKLLQAVREALPPDLGNRFANVTILVFGEPPLNLPSLRAHARQLAGGRGLKEEDLKRIALAWADESEREA